MKTLFFLLLLPAFSYAQDFYNLPDEEINPEAEEVLIKKPEKYLRDESMIYDLDTNLGIKDQRRYTGGDKNRFSLAGHISGEYEHLSNLFGLEVALMRRSQRYNQFWYGAQLFQVKTKFDAITQNKAGGTNPNSDSQFQRPNGTDNNIFAVGLGVGYRFKLLLDFFETEDTFETVDVFANYLRMDETFIEKQYAGYGLTTNYGIHKRTSTSFFYGGKLSYNLGVVTRKALGDESHSDRTFSIGWLAFALEMGFFF